MTVCYLLLMTINLIQISVAVPHYRSLRQTESQTCKTYDGQNGICVDIIKCPKLLDLKINNGHNPVIVNILKRSHCGSPDMSFVCCEEADVADSYTCGTSNTKVERIVGGRNASLGAWPWIAAFGYRGGNSAVVFQCAGSLISDKFIITAGHCVKDIGDMHLAVVRLGDLDLNPEVSDNATPMEIPKEDFNIIVHPGFKLKPTIVNDIALLLLKIPVSFTDFIRPLCLPYEPEFRNNGYYNRKRPYIIGWGTTGHGEIEASWLQETTVSIVNVTTCGQAYNSDDTVEINDNVLCAGGNGKDTCQGDSGGPLIFIQEDKFVLGGIVSYGVRCADEKFPGVYTRVVSYMKWIENNMHEEHVPTTTKPTEQSQRLIETKPTNAAPVITEGIPTVAPASTQTWPTVDPLVAHQEWPPETSPTVGPVVSQTSPAFAKIISQTWPTVPPIIIQTKPTRAPIYTQRPTIAPIHNFLGNNPGKILEKVTWDQCGKAVRNDPTVHGIERSKVGEWPWIAKLGYRTPTSSGMFLLQTIVNCDGILIANKWIITAVSCDTVTYISKNKSLFARLGSIANYNENPNQIDVDVDTIIHHPEFSSNGKYTLNDIALLRLKQEVKFNGNIYPVCLLRNDEHKKDGFYNGKKLFIATVIDNTTQTTYTHSWQERRYEATTYVVDTTTCAQTYASVSEAVINGNELCVPLSYQNNVPLILGSSLVVTMKNTFYLAGIASYGAVYTNPSKPALFVRIASYIDWINQSVNN